MKFRNSTSRVFLSLAFLSMAGGEVSHAQTTPASSPARLTALRGLEASVRHTRVQAITPHTTPPAWMDYDKVRRGSEFLKQHQDFIEQVLATSSLSATFAARDITPVLMQTGELPHGFSHRMKATGDLIDAVLQPHHSRKEFLTNNMAQAYRLGLLHVGVAKQARGRLHWNPKERVLMNQQAFGLVFYTFAWWPVEALAATKQIDMEKDSQEVEGWLHLWRVLGYEMGVSEALLPTSVPRAKEIVALLRKAQYAGAGESLPDGISDLLGGQVRWLAEGAVAQAASEKSSAAVKPTAQQMLPDLAQKLAQTIQFSPGLSEALGLGSDPTARLLQYASQSAHN